MGIGDSTMVKPTQWTAWSWWKKAEKTWTKNETGTKIQMNIFECIFGCVNECLWEYEISLCAILSLCLDVWIDVINWVFQLGLMKTKKRIQSIPVKKQRTIEWNCNAIYFL